MQAGLGRVKSNLRSRVKKGKMTQEAADKVFSRVKGTLDYSDFGSVDMVRIRPCILHEYRVRIMMITVVHRVNERLKRKLSQLGA